MRVKIGISHTDKLVELEIDDPEAFKKEIERAISDGDLAWLTDAKGRSVGIPANNVAFVEMEDSGSPHTVGFGPGS